MKSIIEGGSLEKFTKIGETDIEKEGNVNMHKIYLKLPKRCNKCGTRTRVVYDVGIGYAEFFCIDCYKFASMFV